VCLGVPLSRWDSPRAILAWLILAIWVMGTALFVMLSLEEWRKLDQRRRNVRELKRLLGTEPPPFEQQAPLQGVQRIVREWVRQKDWPYAAYLALAAVQLIALAIWAG
jgi:hypothetical protein